RCLACHTTPRPVSEKGMPARMDAEGVDCEACHGNAARWLGAHTTIGWRDRTWQEKEALGLVNTKDLRHRAQVCVGCHVGSQSGDGLPRREVTHDMIMAGHPDLKFEFYAFHDNMPHHWDEKGPNADGDFPARVWMVGQLITAKAAVDLLQARAQLPRPARWP